MYDQVEFAARQCDYCVCVFVINEGEKLLKQLACMKSLIDKIDIVVADGGSMDGSTDPERLKTFGVNTLLVKTGAGRLGAQMRMAFAWALDRGYSGVVVVDGNNKDSVEDTLKFVEKLEEGYDHVQGSRFIPGGHHENTPFTRLAGLTLLHVPVMRLASGFRYTDTTNGFRAYSARFLQNSDVAIFRNVFTGYELHYYLAIQAPKRGFRTIEIPVSRRYPAKGKTPTKISPIRGNLQVIYRLLAAACGRFDLPPKR